MPVHRGKKIDVPRTIKVSRIDVKANPELYDLIAQAADKANVSLGEFLVELAADHFHRPDLARVPRKRPGRPRKDAALTVAS